MSNQVEEQAQLPKPVGYRVLIALPVLEETYGESGIIKSIKAISDDNVMSMIGLVIDMGEQAYIDAERFPNGPWCKKGDYIMFRPNSGTRFKVEDVEYRLINDDSIEAVVKNPRAVSRAF